MIKGDIDLSEGWNEQSADEHQRPALTEYEYETDSGTTFVVSILEHPMATGYRVRLSTISPVGNNLRHDYSITTDDTAREAVSTAESFIEFFTRRLSAGAISESDPKIEEIRNVIEDFNGSVLSPLKRWLRRLR